jgi:hypothetical protein
MLLALLMLLTPWLAPAPAGEPPAAPSDEPLFCTDPVAAICENINREKVDYTGLKKRLRDASHSSDREAAILGTIKDIEKQSFIPSFEESRSRLIAGIDGMAGLQPPVRSALKDAITPVKYVSLSGSIDAAARLKELKQKLPANSILYKATPEAADVVLHFRLERLTPVEREALQISLQTLALFMSQAQGCGESLPLNAFSFGDKWGTPSVTLCMATVLKLQPLDVQTRYPILGSVLAHELGHHIDSAHRPELYSKYLSCLKETNSDAIGSERKAAEATADFWSAVALGNMLKTRAALLDEPPDAQRDRALDFVRGSLQWACDVPDGKIHPPQAFRLGQIYGQDPEIRRMLGCKPKPSCGLQGKQ